MSLENIFHYSRGFLFFLNHEAGLEMAYPSQSQQHMALDEKTLSTSKTGDAMRTNCPQTAEPSILVAECLHLLISISINVVMPVD